MHIGHVFWRGVRQLPSGGVWDLGCAMWSVGLEACGVIMEFSAPSMECGIWVLDFGYLIWDVRC